MAINALLFCAVLSAVFCIRSKYVGSMRMLYVFKPLTTLLILTVAWLAGSGSTYADLVFAGLVFCLAGDVFLMLPSDRFLAGLSSFFIAHLFFVAAFCLNRSPGLSWSIAALLFLAGVGIWLSLSSHVGNLKVAVLAYMTVILIMTWQAWERWMDVKTTLSLMAGIGATIFTFSDLILAVNRFRKNIRHADAIVLTAYYLSIALMALSTGQ
jgi:uncharacterized membrane protein YhhN